MRRTAVLALAALGVALSVSVVGRDAGPSLLRTFKVDRPFAFVVEDTKTHQVLVAGIVANP